MIRRLSLMAAGASAMGGCTPHQSAESFETWAIVIVVSLIGLAFWINAERRD
jgi:hypothetical protein